MGSAIVVLDEPTVFGNKKIRTGTISASASYATGGDAIVWDTVLGFKVEKVIISPTNVNYLADVSGNLLLAYVSGTTAAELDEATNTDDLSASVAPFIAIGTVS
jgi:hypothetical protein